MSPSSRSRLLELPAADRPRERLADAGAQSLSDAELLAIVLRTGAAGCDAIDLARDLLAKSGSLRALARCAHVELVRLARGVGAAKAAELCAAFELARRLGRTRGERPRLTDSQAVFDALGPGLQLLNQEVLQVALLDTRLRLMRVEEVSRGSVNESIAHPREIFRPAISHAAYAIVVLHNHPSGDPSPSEADRRMTRKLAEAAHVLDIRLVDHLIIGDAEAGRAPYFSFKEAGFL